MKTTDRFKMGTTWKIFSLASLLLIPALALAEGTSVGGGANAIQGELVDKVIFESKWDPRTDPAFREHVLPTLNYIRQNLPHLADDLELILTKRWYKPDKRIAVSTSADVVLVSDQMAYQDKNGVFVDGSAYEQATPRARGNMILHELFQGLRVEKWLRSPKGKDEVGGTAVAIMSQEIFERTPKTPEEMQKLVANYLGNTYGTAAQVKDFLRRAQNNAPPGRGTFTQSSCTNKKYIFFGQLELALDRLGRRPRQGPDSTNSYFELDPTGESYKAQHVLFVPAQNPEALKDDMWNRLLLAVNGNSIPGDGFHRTLDDSFDYTDFCRRNTAPQDNGSVITSQDFQFKRVPGLEDAGPASTGAPNSTEAK